MTGLSSIAGHQGRNLLFMSRSILLVDDSAVIRRTLRRVFEEHQGWGVCGEAVDGRDAILKAQTLSPDVIILDLSMPVMDGLAAAKELKKLLPGVPLLMFTTFKTAHLEREAEAAGITAVISKNDPVDRLVSGIEQVLGA